MFTLFRGGIDNLVAAYAISALSQSASSNQLVREVKRYKIPNESLVIRECWLRGKAMNDGLFHARLRTSSERLFWLGVVMEVLGIAAIVFPIIFRLAALLVGWVLPISGVGTFIGSFPIPGTGPFFAALLLGLLFHSGRRIRAL